MDTMYMTVIIVYLLNGYVHGGKEDPTDCKGGPKYETCECNDRPADPVNGYIEVVNKTFSIYKCYRGYILNVSAIIRCHNGGKDNPNYWYTTDNVCIAIDDCNPNPCLYVDVCIDGIDNYTCICLPGFTGKNCSDNIATSTVSTEESSTNITIDDDSTENQTTSTNTRIEPQSSSMAVSISIPVVTVALAIAILLTLFLRYKRKRSAMSKEKISNPKITNKSYNHDDQGNPYIQTSQSQNNEYVGIRKDNAVSAVRSGSVYQRIDKAAEGEIVKDSSYDHLGITSNKLLNDTYSHISVISSKGSHLDDLTYSHMHGINLTQEVSENTYNDEGDNSYDRLAPLHRYSNTSINNYDFSRNETE